MQKQFDLLNEICSIFFSAPEKFDSLEYEYKFKFSIPLFKPKKQINKQK